MGKINDYLNYTKVPPGQTGERTIFGDSSDGLDYVYDDRLMEADYRKHEEAKEKTVSQKHTSEYYQEYLCHYYGKPIMLQHIRIGVDVSRGFQYLVFGFKYG